MFMLKRQMKLDDARADGFDLGTVEDVYAVQLENKMTTQRRRR